MSWTYDYNFLNTMMMIVFPAFMTMIEADNFDYVFLTIIAESTHTGGVFRWSRIFMTHLVA